MQRGPHNHDDTMTRWHDGPIGSVSGIALVVVVSLVAVLAAGEREPATPSTVPAVSFRNHVVPVLTKMGCNSGACHGAAAGKNGFSLTLRGYDPAADYDAITRQAGGRRVNKLEPARSLLLLKPT